MERSSLLLGGASSVPEAGVACLDGRDYCQASPSALKPPVDLSVSCLVVALAEVVGVLESFLGVVVILNFGEKPLEHDSTSRATTVALLRTNCTIYPTPCQT